MAGLATLGMAFVYLMCDGNVYLRAFAVILGATAAAVFWSPRPQMFSFMLGALVLYLLHLYKRERLDRLWLIPPMHADLGESARRVCHRVYFSVRLDDRGSAGEPVQRRRSRRRVSGAGCARW